MPRPKKPIQNPAFAIRLPPELLSKIKEIAQRLYLSDAETIRLAAAIGLDFFERIDCDLAAAVCDKALHPALRRSGLSTDSVIHAAHHAPEPPLPDIASAKQIAPPAIPGHDTAIRALAYRAKDTAEGQQIAAVKAKKPVKTLPPPKALKT